MATPHHELRRNPVLVDVLNEETGLSTPGVDKSVDGLRMNPGQGVRTARPGFLVKKLPNDNFYEIQSLTKQDPKCCKRTVMNARSGGRVAPACVLVMAQEPSRNAGERPGDRLSTGLDRLRCCFQPCPETACFPTSSI
jgi:hypothetical protein